MTIPSSGVVAFSQISSEMGFATSTTRSLLETNVRKLAGRQTGSVSITNLRGRIAEPRGAYWTNFSATAGDRAQFELGDSAWFTNISNPTAYYELYQYPWYNTQNLYPPGWGGGPVLTGSADAQGIIYRFEQNFNDVFWWPRPKGNYNEFYVYNYAAGGYGPVGWWEWLGNFQDTGQLFIDNVSFQENQWIQRHTNTQGGEF